MRRPYATVVVLIALVALIAVGLPARAQGGAGVSAIYKTSGVSESGDHVSMSFTVRLTNLGSDSVSFSLVKLADRANANTFARWENVSIAGKGKVDLSESISVPAAEYKRWKGGGPANLWAVAPDPQGTTRATAITASYQASGW